MGGLVYVILHAGRADLNVSETVADLVALAIGLLSAWLYAALLESGRRQGTFGKMALGIKVTDRDGRRISFLRATLRYLAKYLSALPCGVGFVIAAFDPKRRAAHDFVARTLVLDAK